MEKVNFDCQSTECKYDTNETTNTIHIQRNKIYMSKYISLSIPPPCHNYFTIIINKYEIEYLITAEANWSDEFSKSRQLEHSPGKLRAQLE